MSARARLVFSNIVREPAFAWVAGELGWQPSGEPRQYAQSVERVWQPGDAAAKVTYVDDRMVDTQYLVVEGAEEEVAAIRQAVGRIAPLATREYARQLMDPAGEPYDPVLGLYVAALIAPAHADAEILSWIAEAMRHPNAEVRRAACFATTYPGWREFEPLLVRAAESDPAAEVRQFAARTLDALRRNAWKEE